MINWKNQLATFVTVTAALFCGAFLVNHVQAGPGDNPATTPAPPMVYSGTLTDDCGVAKDGNYWFRLSLMASAKSNTACVTTTSSKVQVVDGRFGVDLDPQCAKSLQSAPDQWMKVEVSTKVTQPTKSSDWTKVADPAQLGSVAHAARATYADQATHAKTADYATSTGWATAAEGLNPTKQLWSSNKKGNYSLVDIFNDHSQNKGLKHGIYDCNLVSDNTDHYTAFRFVAAVGKYKNNHKRSQEIWPQNIYEDWSPENSRNVREDK